MYIDNRMKLYGRGDTMLDQDDNKKEEKYLSNSNLISLVCMEKILKNQQVVDLECGHTYHMHCARKWVLDARTCPACRKAVNP